MSDEGLPKATVNKVIKDCVPNDLKVAAEVRDIIAEASFEFVQLLASEANDVCSKDNKSTIQPEHIFTSLDHLGFSEYIPEIKAYYAKLKKDAQERAERLKEGDDTAQFTHEELVAQQHALFKAAE